MPGSVLHKTAKNLVLNLLEYFQNEKDNGGPLLSVNSVQERVASALKIGRSTIGRILQDAKNDVPFQNKVTRKRTKR